MMIYFRCCRDPHKKTNLLFDKLRVNSDRIEIYISPPVRGEAAGPKKDFCKKLFSLLCSLLLLSFFYTATAVGQNAEGITDQYRKALEMEPSNMDARYLLGVALLREKAYKEAVTHLLKVYPSRAGEAEMNYNIGLAYTGNGELQKAYKHYRKVGEINTMEAKDKFHLDAAYYNLGIAFQRDGNLDEALNAYQEAIRINPEQSNVYCTRGEILYQRKDYNAALDSLMTCRSKNPDNKGANRYISAISQARGTEYLNQKKYKEARIELDKAIKTDPANEAAYYYMGYLEYLDGNYRKSLSFLDMMKGTEREDMKNALASMLYNVGGALQKKEDWAGAIIAFSQALNLHKDDSELRFFLGYSYMKAGEYDPAVAAFKEILRVDPKHQKAAINLAVVAEIAVKSHLGSGEEFLQNKSYNEALKEFNYVISIDPNNRKGLEGVESAKRGIEKLNKEAAVKREREIAIKLQEAEKFITDRKYLMARKSFEAVIQLEPSNQKAREGINKIAEFTAEANKKSIEAGQKAFAAGQYYTAIIEYRLLLEYDPTNNTVSEKLGIALKRLSEQISPLLSEARQHEDANRFSEAVAAYHKILDMQPDHKEALKEKNRVSDKLDKAFNEALSRGRENLKSGELMKAAENLGRALELKPDNVVAMEELSKISGKLKKIVDVKLAGAASAVKNGKYSEAVSNYKAALLIDRDNKEAALGLQNTTRLRDEAIEKRMSSGTKAFKEGIYYQAIVSFSEVLQIDSGNPEALKLQKEARSKMDELVGPWVKSGAEAFKKGDMEGATLSFKKVLNADPLNKDAREYLGKVDTQKAKASVDKEVEKHYLRGIELYTDGKYRDAIESWKRVLELDQKHEKAVLNIEKAKRKMEGVMDTK